MITRAPTTPEEWWEAEQAAHRTSARKDWYTMSDFRDEAGMTVMVAAKTTRKLMADQVVFRLPAGSHTRYATRAVRPTWGFLLELAEKSIDPDKRSRRGRKKSVEARRVESLSPDQFNRVRTVVTRLRAHCGEGPIPPHLLVWDEGAGAGGTGDWAAALEVLDDAYHGSVSSEYVTALRNLLDLCATQGWICSTPRHEEGFRPFPVEWATIYEQWTDGLNYKRGSGIIDLLSTLERVGVQDPQAVVWEEVVSKLDGTMKAAGLDYQRRKRVRAVYRFLRDEGRIVGPEWTGMTSRRKNWITDSEANQIGGVYGTYGSAWNGSTDPLAWPWPGETPRALVEGDYGLRFLMMARTCPLERKGEFSLPRRGVRAPGTTRETQDRSTEPIAAKTVAMHLYEMSPMLERVGKAFEVDWSHEEADLRVLLDPRKWEEFLLAGSWRQWPSYMQRGMRTFGEYLSPLLEQHAVTRKDQQVAKNAAAVSRMLAGNGGWIDSADEGQPSVGTLLAERAERRATKLERDREATQRFEAAWAATKDDFGHDSLVSLGNHALRTFEANYGTVVDQLEMLRSGQSPVTTRKRKKTWARDLQLLLYWTDQIRVPLRAETLRLLNVSERQRDQDGLHARIPAWKMKRKRRGGAFNPYYGKTPYHLALYDLYTLPEGGLDVILGRPHQGNDPFYPNGYGNRYAGNGEFANWVKDFVSEHRAGLPEGVSYEAIVKSKTLKNKFFRHAVAKPLVRMGRADLAAQLLHHANTTMVLTTYGAMSASEVDPTACLRGLSMAREDAA